MLKKKIIFFHPYSCYGGADLSISKLINIIPNGYDIDFLTLTKKPKIRFYTKKKFKVLKLSNKKTFKTVFEIRNLLKVELKKYNKVIFLSNQNFANIIALISSFKLKGLKKIVFERNHLSELDFSENFIDLTKKKIIKFLIKKTYKFSDLIMGNSEELCKDLSNYTGSKVVKLENFYDYKFIQNVSKKKN